VLGVVQAKDLLAGVLFDKRIDIQASIQQPVFVPHSMPALQVLFLTTSSNREAHLVLVVDE
jgi:putative hemolysin